MTSEDVWRFLQTSLECDRKRWKFSQVQVTATTHHRPRSKESTTGLELCAIIFHMQMVLDRFMATENGMSQGKSTNKPLLDDVNVVQFPHGSTEIFWNESHQEKEFRSGVFLKKKISSKILKENRAIPTIKSDDIVAKIYPCCRQMF